MEDTDHTIYLHLYHTAAGASHSTDDDVEKSLACPVIGEEDEDEELSLSFLSFCLFSFFRFGLSRVFFCWFGTLVVGCCRCNGVECKLLVHAQ